MTMTTKDARDLVELWELSRHEGVQGLSFAIIELADRYDAVFAWLEQHALYIQIDDREATQIAATLEEIEKRMEVDHE